MIYTLTLNPALDYIIQVPSYETGIVNRTAGEMILPGGKGINVSIVLKHFGIESVSLGFVSGFTGELLQNLLTAEGVLCDFIRLDTGFSRINVKIKAQEETEINGQGPSLDDVAIERLMKRLEQLQDGDVLVLAGSVPKTVPENIYAKIMQRLSGKQVRIVVDTTGAFLKNVLSEKPFLIKPNLPELEEIFEKKLQTTEDIITAAKALQTAGAENVLVSMGADGALLVAGDGKVYQQKAPSGTVVNTTGSGDSCVAGFLAEWMRTGDFERALCFGVSAGSASAFSEYLATKEETEKIYKEIKE